MGPWRVIPAPRSYGCRSQQLLASVGSEADVMSDRLSSAARLPAAPYSQVVALEATSSCVHLHLWKYPLTVAQQWPLKGPPVASGVWTQTLRRLEGSCVPLASGACARTVRNPPPVREDTEHGPQEAASQAQRPRAPWRSKRTSTRNDGSLTSEGGRAVRSPQASTVQQEAKRDMDGPQRRSTAAVRAVAAT